MTQELYTILIAASPLVELRCAIPLAIGMFQFSWPKALFLSVLGNILPILPLYYFLRYFSDFLSRHFKIMDRFFDWLFSRTKAKTNEQFKKWGSLALVIFVAIPLPLTGAWTGTVAAFLFNINPIVAFGLVSLGVLIAGGIVTTLTIIGVNIF